MNADNDQLRGALDNYIAAHNKLAAIIHCDNAAKGFWPLGGRIDAPTLTPGKRNVGEALMLVVTELAEGMEGHRKDRADEHLPQFSSLTVELADAHIRMMDLGHGLVLPVAEALARKLIYNRERPFMHGKKF